MAAKRCSGLDEGGVDSCAVVEDISLQVPGSRRECTLTAHPAAPKLGAGAQSCGFQQQSSAGAEMLPATSQASA